MVLMELVEKNDDAELVRELLAYGLNRLMTATNVRSRPNFYTLRAHFPGP